MSRGTKKIEYYEKRFGNIAIEKGFITPEQLMEALRIQVTQEVQNGRHMLIGEIMLNKGMISYQQVEEVLKELFEKSGANP